MTVVEHVPSCQAAVRGPVLAVELLHQPSRRGGEAFPDDIPPHSGLGKPFVQEIQLRVVEGAQMRQCYQELSGSRLFQIVNWTARVFWKG